MHPLRKTVVTLCLLLLAIGLCLQPVQAQVTDTEGNPTPLFFWRVEGDFEGDKMHFTWIVTEMPDGNVAKTRDVIKIDITEQCTVTGPGVTIYEKAAHFAGSDWIQCELPNFVETVEKQLGAVIGEDGCQCNFNTVVAPFAGARFTVPSGSGKTPVATWSNLRLFAAEQQTVLFVDQHVFESNVGYDSAGVYRSTFIGLGASAILHYLADLNGQLTWWLWHHQLQEAATNPKNFLIAWLEGGAANIAPQKELNYELDPNDQMLYIGFDSASGTILKGSISHLLFDPGCGWKGNG
ncbi:MAG: hypothetical protein DYG89_09235 [Caldilinea sp. CFX5]|nr:hypothetical protein [Caldilinea sp. CFX5]